MRFKKSTVVTDDGHNSEEDTSEGDPFNNYFYMDDEDFDVSLYFTLVNI